LELVVGTDIRIANFLEPLRSDPQDLWSCLWPLSQSSIEVKMIGATHVLPSRSSCNVKTRHLILCFHQRKEIYLPLAPEEFCEIERRGKLYFLRIA